MGSTCYSTESDDIDDATIDLAELFGVHAGIALGHARKKEQLNEALTSRQMIGQAIGIVMVRYEIDADRAFQFLVRASTTSNLKLRDIAQELIDNHNARHSS